MKGAKGEPTADFKVGYYDTPCDVSFEWMWAGFADSGRNSTDPYIDPDNSPGRFATGYHHSSNSHHGASQRGGDRHFPYERNINS